ncbi:hypothetical protein [Ferrovibrio sp.]|uniref:hypothetical protein n=1 Tax=Ferrovibrio sp. TaxID=1917215 RepID=UPI0025BE6E96|nr:hypothetical protein [Ferrovibrio sp.]MBX3455565.1 hypothetical protein [Ferrovibrio sp.]
MAINLMEATIFAVLLSAPTPPFQCRLTADETQAICSNDLTMKEEAGGRLMFSNGISVEKNRKRELVFSNGLSSYFDSFGWLRFSNQYAVRRMETDIFKIAPPKVAAGSRQPADMLCRYTVPKMTVRCTPA